MKAEYVEEPANEEITSFEVTPSYRSRHVFESQYMTTYMKCDDRTCWSPFRTSVNKFFPHRRVPALIPISNTSAGLVAMALEPDMFKQQIKFLSLAQRVVLEEVLAPEHLVQKYGKFIPYDAYLPSCQTKVEDRTCKVCFKYHATKKSLALQKKLCKRSKTSRADLKRICATKRKATLKEDTRDSSEEEIEEADQNNSLVLIEEAEEEEDLVLVSCRPTFCTVGDGGLDVILNLKEWLKSPWTEDV